MKEFIYDPKTKEKCWYKVVCGDTINRCPVDVFCLRHYKMSALTHSATLEGKECYPIKLYLDKNEIDKEAFNELRTIQQNIGEFVSDGRNLLIYGVIAGCGKTSWARKLLLSYFDSIWKTADVSECRGLFISLPRLMSAMKENITKPNEYYQYIQDNVINADLVIWDELNYKDMSEYEHSYLLTIIDRRLSLGKSNIYTGNFTLEILEKKLGTRLASRIVGGSKVIELKGSDKRNWGNM